MLASSYVRHYFRLVAFVLCRLASCYDIQEWLHHGAIYNSVGYIAHAQSEL